MRKKWHRGRGVKFYFTLSNAHITLSGASSSLWESVELVWRRGGTTAVTSPARVVEQLDLATGALSRTATFHELSLVCTLFRGAAYEPKLCEVSVRESAGAASKSASAGAMELDLARYVSAAAAEPAPRSSELEMPLPHVGTLRVALGSRWLGASALPDEEGGGEEEGVSAIGTGRGDN